jgi:hypothetical protein
VDDAERPARGGIRRPGTRDGITHGDDWTRDALVMSNRANIHSRR